MDMPCISLEDLRYCTDLIKTDLGEKGSSGFSKHGQRTLTIGSLSHSQMSGLMSCLLASDAAYCQTSSDNSQDRFLIWKAHLLRGKTFL